MAHFVARKGRSESKIGLDDVELELQFPETQAISKPSKETEKDQKHQVGSVHGEEAKEMIKNFQDEDDGPVMISIERIPFGKVHGVRGRHKGNDNAPKRISVSDFSVPKFTMQLAENQGNPRQLAALLAAKQSKKKRILRYKPVTSQEAIPDPSVDYAESSGTTLKFSN